MVAELIAECKELLAKAEKLADAEPTQLRIAAHRLRLFLEQHGVHLHAPEPEPEASQDAEPAGADDLDTLTRKDLDAKATELGVEAPDKLPNKDAVISAIREKLNDAEPDSESDSETEE